MVPVNKHERSRESGKIYTIQTTNVSTSNFQLHHILRFLIVINLIKNAFLLPGFESPMSQSRQKIEPLCPRPDSF